MYPNTDYLIFVQRHLYFQFIGKNTTRKLIILLAGKLTVTLMLQCVRLSVVFCNVCIVAKRCCLAERLSEEANRK